MEFFDYVILIAKCAGLFLVLMITLKLTTRRSSASSVKTTSQPMAKIPTLRLKLHSARNLEFEWTGVVGAYQYQLLEKIDDYSGYQPIGRPKKPGTRSLTWAVPVHSRLNARYLLRAFHYDGSIDSNPVHVGNQLISALRRPVNSLVSTGLIAHLSVGGRRLTLAEDDHPAGSPGAYLGATYEFEYDDYGQWVKKAYVQWVNITTQTGPEPLLAEKTVVNAAPSRDRVGSTSRKYSWLSGYDFPTLSLLRHNQP